MVAGLLILGNFLKAGGGIDLVNTLALVTVVFLLAIYALVIVTCLKLRGRDEDERSFRANTPLLIIGLIGNLAILGFSICDDPSSLLWCAGLLAVGMVLFLIERAFGSRNRRDDARRGAPETADRKGA